ncbi:hypothetical protein Nmel_011846 [Mimus melanotis]
MVQYPSAIRQKKPQWFIQNLCVNLKSRVTGILWDGGLNPKGFVLFCVWHKVYIHAQSRAQRVRQQGGYIRRAPRKACLFS